MGVDQRTGEGTNPRIPRVVSKSDRDHGTATTDNRNLGLTPTVTISRSNLSLSLYPIQGIILDHPSFDVRGVLKLVEIPIPPPTLPSVLLLGQWVEE